MDINTFTFEHRWAVIARQRGCLELKRFGILDTCLAEAG